jgi:flavin-dependent dehydrogenase
MIPIPDKYFSSPQGHKIHFSKQDGTPIGIKIEKEKLLQELYHDCEKFGVTFLLNTHASSAEDSDGVIKVFTVSKGKNSSIKASKAIVADGVNSRIAGTLGINDGRNQLLTAHVVKYILAGFDRYTPGTWNFYFGEAFHSNAPVLIGPSFYGDTTVEVTIMGSKVQKPNGIFKRVVDDSPLSEMFYGTKVIDKHACSLKVFDALKVPYKGNVLVAGDAAAYIEVEIQGGLMCGYHAGTAAYLELNGKKGFDLYTKWWQQSFEFNSAEWAKVAQGYALVPVYTDNELDYLFSLIEDEVLFGTFSQYTTPKVMWTAILKHKKRIYAEKPELFKKVEKIRSMSLSASFTDH